MEEIKNIPQAPVGNQSTRTITVFFSRYSDWLSRLVCVVSRSKFSHASISLDKDESEFYSFNFKGFIVEHPGLRKFRRNHVRVRIPVSDEDFRVIQDEVMTFQENRKKYKYSIWGVIFCFLRIPHKFKHHYFCSQFVAELLSQTKAVKLRKSAGRYFPGELLKALRKGGLLNQQAVIVES